MESSALSAVQNATALASHIFDKILKFSFNISSTEGIGYEPFWGPQTSTMNFCEEDYEHTPYVAELFNTLTNITYISLGIYGILQNRRIGLRGLGAQLPYLSLINLGTMSSIFHSSLKFYTQLADEFSMLIATFIVAHRLLTSTQPPPLPPHILTFLLIATFLITLLYQLTTGSSTLQQIVFTSTAYWLWGACFKLVNDTVPDPELRKHMLLMARNGILFFVGGYVFWTLDLRVCDTLRGWRGAVGMPWAAGLEFHGYWHIMTGIGVYIFMVLVECLRLAPSMNSQDPDIPRLTYSGRWPLPVTLEPGKTKGE